MKGWSYKGTYPKLHFGLHDSDVVEQSASLKSDSLYLNMHVIVKACITSQGQATSKTTK
jgi:hypothetical protein